MKIAFLSHKTRETSFRECGSILEGMKDLGHEISFVSLNIPLDDDNSKHSFQITSRPYDKAIRKLFFKISYFFGKKDTILLFPRKMVDNLDQIEFYNMKFNIPSSVDEYLSLAYDKNWRKSNPFWTYEKATGINYDFFTHNNRHEYPLF